MSGKIVETNGREWRVVPHRNNSEEFERNKKKEMLKSLQQKRLTEKKRTETKDGKRIKVSEMTNVQRRDRLISSKWDREQCQVGVKRDVVVCAWTHTFNTTPSSSTQTHTSLLLSVSRSVLCSPLRPGMFSGSVALGWWSVSTLSEASDNS